MAKAAEHTTATANGAQGDSEAPVEAIDGEPIPPPEKPPRKRGRPPGYPKSGGRKKGVKNWTSEEVRNALLGKSEAVETLADIVAGRQLLVSGPTGKPIWRYPTLQERLTGLKCPSSKNIRQMIDLRIGGSGPSWV